MSEQNPPNFKMDSHSQIAQMADEALYGPGTTSIPDFMRDPFGMLQRRWRWMLIALLVGAAMSTAFVLSVKPRFNATATIQVVTQQIPEALVRSTIEDDPLMRINAMMGSILSTREIVSLIEKHDLYANLRGSVEFSEIVEFTRSDITIEVRAGIGQQRQGQSAQLFTVSFQADGAEVAAAVANDIAARITLENIRIRTRQATAITEFLRRQLVRAETSLREQNQKITAFKTLHRGELPDELTMNLSKMDRLQLQRQSLSLQIAEAETRLATLATHSGVAGTGAVVTPGAERYALQQQLAKELTSLTERHPDVIALRRQIAALASDPEMVVADAPEPPPSRIFLVEATRRALGELRFQLEEVERDLKGLDARVASTPARQEVLIALEEEETVLRENYLEFLRKVQDAELAQNLESEQQGERFSIVDPAAVPSDDNRMRLGYAALGGLASLALSLGIGFFFEFIDSVLVTEDQLVAESDLPVLGSAPRI